MSISAALLDFAIFMIDRIGYVGVGLVLLVDNAGIPIPSEAVLALTGAAARSGHMNELAVIGLGIVAQTAGSCLSFWIGSVGGERLVRRYGKYLFISMEDYAKTQVWFKKHGPRAIFVSRLTPVVRTFMGFAAGGAKMNFAAFFWQSLAGSALWTVIWAGLGYAVGDSWHTYYEYMHYVDYAVLVGLAVLIIRFGLKRLHNTGKRKPAHAKKK